MALPFKTTRGKMYYIKSKLTRKGNTTYYMTRKEDETCLDHLPEGYEVFEKYDTETLYIRKKQPSQFSPAVVEAISRELKTNTSIQSFQLDIKGNEISIYVAEDSMFGRRLSELMKVIRQEDESEPYYEVKRYCFRGSIDDWITVGQEEDIEKVAKEYLIHLGKESYYDLFGY